MNAKGKVIATDLDGTLFFPKRRIRMLSSRNKKFLRRFIDDGGKVLIVSGRNKYYLNKLQKRLKRKIDVAGCNSAFLIIDGKEIDNKPLDNIKAIEVVNYVMDKFKFAGIFSMSEDYNMITPTTGFDPIHRIGYIFYQWAQMVYREPCVRDTKKLIEEVKNGKLYKLMIFFGVSNKSKIRCREANRELREKFPDLEFSWCGELIEVTAKGCSKADGIKQYLDYLKIKHDNVMVVGDSGNDISMFKEFKNSFCMSHAPVHISKYASHIINSVDELEQYFVDTKEEKIYE